MKLFTIKNDIIYRKHFGIIFPEECFKYLDMYVCFKYQDIYTYTFVKHSHITNFFLDFSISIRDTFQHFVQCPDQLQKPDSILTLNCFCTCIQCSRLKSGGVDGSGHFSIQNCCPLLSGLGVVRIESLFFKSAG